MPETRPKKSIAERRPEMTRWKRILLAAAGVCFVIGVGLRAFGGGAAPEGAGLEGDPQGSAGSSTGSSPNTFLPGSGPDVGSSPSAQGEPEAGAAASTADYSPFFLKSGFSFFVAFCVGFAARIWMKMALLVLGTLFLALFLLSYAGAIEVDWTTLEGWWQAFADRVGDEAGSFQTFVTGSLPQAGLAGLGLVTGFKKR